MKRKRQKEHSVSRSEDRSLLLCTVFEGRRIHRDNPKEVIVLTIEDFVLVNQPKTEKTRD